MTRENRAPFDPRRPFDELPDLPPAVELETKGLLKLCIEARAALEGLRRVGGLIPNQSMLINTIPLLEAQTSSEIENIVTTTDELFRYAQLEREPLDSATKEALSYRRALRLGFASLKDRPLSTATAILVCSAIKHVEMEIRRVPGTALAHGASGEIVYTPPVGESLLRDKLTNWERFIHERTELDPVIRMAVAHYQFEAIHPFTDGNGRAGRVLNLLFLIDQGLLDLPVLYLSRYILQTKAEYYQRLLDVTTHGAWEPWVGYMLNAVRETAGWTTKKIEAIAQLHQSATKYVRTALPKIYRRELVDTIFDQPYCRIENVVETGIAQRQTAALYLRALVDIGVLVELPKIGRERLFVHPALMRLLTSDAPFDPETVYVMPVKSRRSRR